MKLASRGDASALNRAAVPEDRGEAAHRVDFRSQRNPEAAPEGERDHSQQIDEDVLWEIKPDKRRGHVLGVRPYKVAMGVVEHEVALAEGCRGANVLYNRARHIPATVPRQAQAEPEVSVLVVAEEPVVESTNFDKGVTPVERRRGAGREDFAREERGAGRLPVAALPSDAAHMQRITRRVQRVRIRRHHDPAREERILGQLCRCMKQLLEPTRLGKCIWVEKREPVNVGGLPHSHVVRRSKPDILIEADELQVLEHLFEVFGRTVDACVVDNHRLIRTATLLLQGHQRAAEQRARVRVHDGDGHSEALHESRL